MKGIVTAVSKNRTRAAVLTDEGYTVFDIEDGEVHLNDIISGCLDEHGSETVTIQGSGHTLSVCIEAIGASLESARFLVDRHKTRR